jgi:hypothetical protein
VGRNESDWSGSELRQYVDPVMNILVPQNGGGGGNCVSKLESKLSQGCALHYSVKHTDTEPVCPDHLILRYCSCNTYLLRRRAELKAAPGSTWLMRNWTLGNNEPLAVSTYISGVISCCA